MPHQVQSEEPGEGLVGLPGVVAEPSLGRGALLPHSTSDRLLSGARCFSSWSLSFLSCVLQGW